MLTPRNSNTPTPRPPQDKDEWIAILVALGVLGGTAGWVIFGGLPPLRLGNVNADLANEELAISSSSNNSQVDSALNTLDAEASADAETSAGGTDSSSAIADDTALLAEEEEAQTTDELAPTSAVPTMSQSADMPQSQVAPSSSAEENAQTAPSASESSDHASESPEPLTGSITVPEPRVPEDIAAGILTPQREPLVFSDLPDDHWGKPYIDALTALGILNGFPDGSYAPDSPMTRAELAVQVAQAFDVESTLPSETFTDIPEGYWAAITIDEAVTTGFMRGYPNDVFQPEQTVPRVQVLVTLATGLTLSEASQPNTALQQYDDQATIPEWARAKVASAIDSGVISTSSEGPIALRPNTPATRAEVAAMLHSALVYLGKVEPIE